MGIWNAPPGGFTAHQLRSRRRHRIQVQIAVVVAATLSLGGVAGYRWVTSVTAVDRSRAVELFRAGRDVVASGDEAGDRLRRDGVRVSTDEGGSTATGADGREQKHRSEQEAAPQRGSDTSQPANGPHRRSSGSDRFQPPREGVYSWQTEGYEEVGGARREMPAETQRIITIEDGSWMQHHYFSEERQIWTHFQQSQEVVEIVEQRNKVTFGPVTRESKIDFSPPMVAAPAKLRVGYRWGGEWDGDTSGTYSSRIFERTTMDIGGERVEVWGMTYVIELRGEQDGRVDAEVWFAPEPGLTVKEHYIQNVESGGARYHAEWLQTLKSLEPRQ